MPNLAREIVRGNRGAIEPSERLNLKGILVGNPLTDTATDNLGAIDFWWCVCVFFPPYNYFLLAEKHPPLGSGITR